MNTNAKYMPVAEADKLVWFANFQSKIALYATVLNLTPNEVSSVQKDYTFYNYLITLLEAYKQTVNNLVSYKNLFKHAVLQQQLGAVPLPPSMGAAPVQSSQGAFDRIARLVHRIKSSEAYNESIGQDLGIIAPAHTVELNHIQPQLKVTLRAGKPYIRCKRGVADAIDLYVDREDGAGFVFLQRLLRLYYTDTAPLPADAHISEWHYKAIYVIGNEKTGLMSTVQSVLLKKE